MPAFWKSLDRERLEARGPVRETLREFRRDTIRPALFGTRPTGRTNAVDLRKDLYYSCID